MSSRTHPFTLTFARTCDIDNTQFPRISRHMPGYGESGERSPETRTRLDLAREEMKKEKAPVLIPEKKVLSPIKKIGPG